MSEIKITGQKRLVIVTGRAHPQLAIDIAEVLATRGRAAGGERRESESSGGNESGEVRHGEMTNYM